ncbi:hypothetical protein [Paenibacillus polymyxa]|uniref:Uncharacterized protein n=1 Tax=Paenibacillus polymyxa TaxID=1406 RepID=A0ABX2ZA91_PAEPO|nr:hypothetical protein [Paenibacillus polymyxa]ODA08221.1 hypothetical protein A7312_28060 [Paenibacillus polymyxa]
MKVKAKLLVKAYHDLDYEVSGLYLKVIFKEPGRWRKVKYKKTLIRRDYRNDNRSTFLMKCFDVVSDITKLKQVGECTVKEHFKGKIELVNNISDENKLFEIIKKIKNEGIEIEVEI